MGRFEILFSAIFALILECKSIIPNCNSPGTLPDGTEICLSCKDGYYINTTRSNTICIQCMNFCNLCSYTAANSSYNCLNCSAGFRQDVPNYNCTQCPIGCSNCSTTNCFACLPEFTMEKDGSCTHNSNFWKYFFIVIGAAGVGGAGYLIYLKYFSSKREGVIGNDYEKEAYRQVNDTIKKKLDAS